MGDKIYKSKHYLLWTFKELVELYNTDHDDGSDGISYYFLRSTVKAEKPIFKVSDTAEDDCRCEKCKNLELLLIGIRRAIHKKNKDLAKSIHINPETFIAQLVCSAKNFKCCNQECLECPEKGLVAHSVVIVSNETIHERNIAFSCNMKLLDYLKVINPRLKTVYFWSDGMQASLD